MDIPTLNFEQLTWARKKKAARRIELEPCNDIDTTKLKRSNAMGYIEFAVRCKQSPNHEITCNNCFDERFKEYNELSQLSQVETSQKSRWLRLTKAGSALQSSSKCTELLRPLHNTTCIQCYNDRLEVFKKVSLEETDEVQKQKFKNELDALEKMSEWQRNDWMAINLGLLSFSFCKNSNNTYTQKI